MDNEWVNKTVKVSLKNGFYYKGVVISEGKNFIKIIDIKNKNVFINFESVISIEEVSE